MLPWRRDYLSEEVLGAARSWFNALCADDYDLPAFQAWQRRQQGGGGSDDGEGWDEDEEGGGGGGVGAGRGQPQPADFWALQQEFYRGAPKHEGGGDGGGEAGQQEQEEAVQDS